MLTTEQEQKIKNAASFGFHHAVPCDVVNSTFDAIVTAIKAYDELKDVEEVKAASAVTGINFYGTLKEVEKVEKAAENDDCYVVFRPNIGLTIASSMRNIRVFSNIREMITKLTKEKNEHIYVAEEEFIDNRTNWQHCHYVLSGSDDVNDINARAGICDYKSFKKG